MEKFYYLRRPDSGGLHRCGIVYLVEESGVVARGISLCNHDEDSFCKDRGLIFNKSEKKYIPFIGGLEKARRRAIHALRSGKRCKPIQRQEAMEKVSGFGFMYKSEFDPLLTPF